MRYIDMDSTAKNRVILTKNDIIKGLQAIGVKNGQSLIVHTSLSSMGFVCGGAQIVIEALLECVGEDGTIIMPTQSWKNLDPTSGVHWEEPEEWWQIIRDNWPVYDKNITPTNTMGAVAEMFRKWPGAKRSNHPARSLAAVGKNADYLTKDHDLSQIFGEESPLGKLYKLNGYILLLGVGYDKNTSIHLADFRADYPSKHYANESSAIMMDGKRQWVTYETLVVDGEDFNEIGEESYFVRRKHMRNDLILIASADKNWGLGKNNQLLKPIPEDLKRFSSFTRGNLIIVGRKTLETFRDKKPLPERVNVVLTRDKAFTCEGAVIVHDLEALSKTIADFKGDVYVCGGGTIYQQLLPFCSKALITKIDAQYEADSHLMNLDQASDWTKVHEEDWQESRVGVRFRYVEYSRL